MKDKRLGVSPWLCLCFFLPLITGCTVFRGLNEYRTATNNYRLTVSLPAGDMPASILAVVDGLTTFQLRREPPVASLFTPPYERVSFIVRVPAGITLQSLISRLESHDIRVLQTERQS